MQAYSPSPAASASYLKDSRPQSNAFTESKVFDATESEHFLASQPVAQTLTSPNKGRRRLRNLVLIGLAVAALLFLAVSLPIFFTVIRKHHNTKAATDSAGAVGGGGSGTPNPNSPTGAISGADGSTIKLDNGTEFQYKNAFGGFWVQDPGNPFNDNARPNSWTPPLNTSWRWGVDRVYGVNLGGLFVLEPFITPAIFQRYPQAVDEYTLSQAMAEDTANGGLKQLEDHYNTFITEQDIAAIAGAGLNWIRVPIAFWAIETWEGEPFLAKTSWKYFLRVLTWARKYGLRVSLDLHAVPGSQNGYNHSGRLLNNTANFLVGNMGLANAQRTLYYIRVLTEFISQPEYKNLIPVFGIVNESLVKVIGIDSITSFYLQAHDMIRDITGRGDGNGPYISIHDGFLNTTVWANFLQGSDRIIMDTHPYFSFGGVQTAPVAVIDEASGQPGGKWPLTACNAWGPSLNDSRTTFGVTYAGEFAASPNDCGLYLRGVGQAAKTPDCTPYDQWETYNATMKEGIQNFVKASMDAFGDWFFWTWKIAPSLAGRIEAPLWSYSLGLAQGWIPQDPRTPFGACDALHAESVPFIGEFQPWQTGTPSSIPASSSSQFPWPPVSLVSADVPVSLLPTYTNTAPVLTMPPATFTAAPSRVTQSVNGWVDPKDTALAPTAVAGCAYPSEYDGIFAVLPTAPCTGSVGAGAAVATPPAAPLARRFAKVSL